MKISTCAILTLVCFLVLVSTPHKSSAFIEKHVLRPIFKEVVKKPVETLLKAVGIKRVRKSHKEFRREMVHSKVLFTADTCRVEKITPCPDGKHDIAKAQQPVEIHFDDGVTFIQDRYCRKCGQHFFRGGDPRDEL